MQTVLVDSMANTLDLLANDLTAPDPGEFLTITNVGTLSAGGTVVIAGDGRSVSYTPNPGFSGTETFTYTISDGNGGTDTATVSVEVTDILPPAVSFTFTVTNASGDVVDNVGVGDEFHLNVFVTDVRDVYRGVFSAYLDVTWSGGDATLNGNFQYGELYPNTQSGTFDGAADEIDELGAVDGIDEAAHDGTELLVSIPMIATVAGEMTFTGNPADLIPGNDPPGQNETTLFGESMAVSAARMIFDTASVEVTGTSDNLLQNSNNQFDVNGDTAVTPLNALSVINSLNDPFFATYTRTVGSGRLMLDVSGDSYLSPIDALLVINELDRLSSQTITAASGEPGDTPTTEVEIAAVSVSDPMVEQRLAGR